MVIKKSKKFLAATNAMSIFSKWENKLTISKHLMVAFKRLIQRCSVVKVDKLLKFCFQMKDLGEKKKSLISYILNNIYRFISSVLNNNSNKTSDNIVF